MKLNFRTWSDYHHQIYRIYHGFIALSLLPFSLVFLELEVTDIKSSRVPEIWKWVILALLIPSCIWILMSIWRGNRFTYAELSDGRLRAKLREFRRVEILKYLFLALAGVLALLGLWLTAHYLFVILYFAVLASFSFLRPSEDRFVRNMRLTKEERGKLHSEEIQ